MKATRAMHFPDGRLTRGVLALACLTLGCRGSPVTPSGSQLAMSPNPVVFPVAYVGQTAHASFEVRNDGAPRRQVQLSSAPPFGSEVATVNLPGGSSKQVSLSFTAERAGEQTGVLLVDTGEAVVEVPLQASALEPLACAPAACATARFDLDTSVCVATPVADGTACAGENLCLSGSSCEGGVCVGQARDCDDHDACTTDLCDPGSGCVHLQATARCGASSDPCRAGACDPAKGCIEVDAVDGTACGPADCTTADVCLQGVCKTVPLNDGAACGAPSPCQARGQCQSHVCVRPPQTELTPTWTVWAADGGAVAWDSLSDGQSNVYWREIDPVVGTTALRSVTRDGLSRFSVPVPSSQQVAIIDTLLVLRSGSHLEARTLGAADLVWSVDFQPDEVVGTNPVAAVVVRAFARGPAGVLYVALDELAADLLTSVGADVAALDLGTGATRWKVHFTAQRIDEGVVMPVDEVGFLYLGTVNVDDGVNRMVSVTRQGAVRWNRENPHAAPAAVFGGRVYHWDHWLSETADGAWVNPNAPLLGPGGYPRLALGTISFVGTRLAEVPDCAQHGQTVMGTALELVRVDPQTSAERWSLEIAGAHAGGLAMTNTLLTSRATILFSQAESYCGAAHDVLREITALGTAGFSCRLQGSLRSFGEGLLDGRLWMAAFTDPATGAQGVRAFEVPGFELPEHGWATAWGSPARDNHSR